MDRNSHTYDNLTLLKDAGAITASGAATVGGVARVLDLGLDARMRCDVIIDPSVVDMADANETYRVAIEGCASAGFGSDVVELTSVAVRDTSRHVVGLNNQVGSTIYRYVRANMTVGGTTPSFNGTIYLGKFA